jgi:hypothetical protein
MRLTVAILSLGVVTSTATTLCASVDQHHNRLEAPVTILLKINSDYPSGINDSVIAGAIDEANTLWAAYGVVLMRAAANAPGPCLNVDIQGPLLTSTPRSALLIPLGAIEFATDGEPNDSVRISLGGVFALLGAPTSGRSVTVGPIVWRDMILARVLGRVLAHEVGHFILKFPAHAPRGLMAANHTALEFSDPSANGFSLTVLLEFRLRQLLASYRHWPSRVRASGPVAGVSPAAPLK